jgi:hypothetical protein
VSVWSLLRRRSASQQSAEPGAGWSGSDFPGTVTADGQRFGLNEHPYADASVSFPGTWTVPSWTFAGVRYEFAATPEPATLLLVAPLALGLPRRVFTRRAHG